MLKVFSYGGGVQSTAALVLATQGRIDFKVFLFCNVGADSENPETLAYVEQVAKPYAQAHGIDLQTLRWIRRNGEPDETLYQRLTRPESRSIGIPVRMSNGAPGQRSCTEDYKIRVVDRWLRERGAKESGAIVGLGISLDEPGRVKPNMDSETQAWKENAWPLIFDVKPALDRQACINVIQSAGLPVPPKSSCYFCPFHSLHTWQMMRQNQPEMFRKACDLETLLNERRERLGRDKIWFSRKLIPLVQATSALTQESLFDDEMCESGYCMI